MLEDNSNRYELPTGALADEAKIIWLEPAGNMAYVRQETIAMPFRTRPPRKGTYFRLVGYSTLKPKAESDQGYFYRRVFWLEAHDRPLSPGGVYGGGGCPCEAVDPATIKPGISGKATERCYERGNSNE